MRRSLVSAVVGVAVVVGGAAFASTTDPVRHGRELFVRTWVPFDSRVAPGGDGLGPMFNATSCVACHNAGGTGGAGPRERNVILGAASQSNPQFLVIHRATTLSGKLPSTSNLALKSERNTPALFGAGLIDGISDAAILAVAANQAADDGVSGRVPHDTRTRIGRFGWKGHTSSLEAFVRNACAAELGLSLVDRAQAVPPPGELEDSWRMVMEAVRATAGPGGKPAGDSPDLTEEDVDALIAFVASLPRPEELVDQPMRAEGLAQFKAIGCDDCHQPDLDGVRGLYSDMLLHDLGGIADGASTYGIRHTSAVDILTDDDLAMISEMPASPTEWRTPPLWGVRDSAPYLHDGRAATVDEAIRMHRVEGEPAAKAYAALHQVDRVRLLGFLDSLVAPGTLAP